MSGLGLELSDLPKPVRPYVAGALLMLLIVAGIFGIATYAAERQVAPVQASIDLHAHDQAAREAYDRELQEAIWIVLQALCAAHPGADCEGIAKMPQPPHHPTSPTR